MIEVPLTATPNQELAIELEGQDCTIQIRQLGEYLYMTLWLDSTLIRDSAICMPMVAIIQGSVANFKGNFVIVDSTSDTLQQGDPSYEELGERFKLLYLTDDEVAEYVIS